MTYILKYAARHGLPRRQRRLAMTLVLNIAINVFLFAIARNIPSPVIARTIPSPVIARNAVTKQSIPDYAV